MARRKKQTDVFLGDVFKVIHGTPERQDAKWLEKGDMVRCIGVYPHIFLCEKMAGSNGWHMRQCYQRRTWWMELERVSI